MVAIIQASLVAGADSVAADGPPPSGPTQRVSGRYRSAGAVELELRVDIDGERPTRRVSGDFFRRTGATAAYSGSFLINTARITPGPREVIVEGEGIFSFASSSPVLRLTIPRAPAIAARPPIEAQFLTTAGVPGALHHCQFQSPAFRTIEWEQDIVANVTPFAQYNTLGLPAPGRPRILSVAAAFGEAGIEVVDTGGANTVPLQLAGSNRLWTNGELHAVIGSALIDRGGGERTLKFRYETRDGGRSWTAPLIVNQAQPVAGDYRSLVLQQDQDMLNHLRAQATTLLQS